MSQTRLFLERHLRQVRRDIIAVLPSLVVPLFLLLVLSGMLSTVNGGGGEGAIFLVGSAVVFSVTGLSRAPSIVADIERGFIDRLALSTTRRRSLMIGMTLGDGLVAIAISLAILLVGVVLGARPTLAGVPVFVLLAVSWCIAFAGFPYALAIRTGSAEAVASAMFLWLPVQLVSTTLVESDKMTPWMQAVVRCNPVTYVLKGLRDTLGGTLSPGTLAAAVAAIVVVGIASWTLMYSAWRARSL